MYIGLYEKMYIGLYQECPLFMSDFNETKISLMIFEKYSSNSMKIHPVGAEVFHADGRTDRQTDMTELIFAFRNFAKATKN
jgi:hypothetical protein